MTIGEALKKAIDERNPAMAGRIVDNLRFRFGMRYADAYGMAHRLTGISEADWEGLMYEADQEEAAARAGEGTS